MRSSAGLVATSAWVLVVPPLSARRRSSTLDRLVLPFSLRSVVPAGQPGPTRLLPAEVSGALAALVLKQAIATGGVPPLLPKMMVSLNVVVEAKPAAPSAKIPPPWLAATLSTIVDAVMSRTPNRLAMPPPSPPAVLPLIVLLVSVIVLPIAKLSIPPPSPPAVLPLTVLLVNVSGASLSIPPPSTTAVLSATVEVIRVREPVLLEIPPPKEPAALLATVLSVSIVVASKA